MIMLFNKSCDECNASYLVLDENKGVTYCFECGLVHKDNTIFSVVDDMERIDLELKNNSKKILKNFNHKNI